MSYVSLGAAILLVLCECLMKVGWQVAGLAAAAASGRKELAQEKEAEVRPLRPLFM